MTRRSSARTAPSWRTIGDMDQARWLRTARNHADRLPPFLAHLATAERIDQYHTAALAKWCSDHQLPIARAGRT